MRVLMKSHDWHEEDPVREILRADAGAVRAIYRRETGVWRIECADPCLEDGEILTVTVESGASFGAVRMTMEHVRLLASVKAR
jgi:hypothetical protein